MTSSRSTQDVPKIQRDVDKLQLAFIKASRRLSQLNEDYPPYWRNLRERDRAEKVLRDLGIEPINPASIEAEKLLAAELQQKLEI